MGTITDPDFDDKVAIRQYGIVSLNGDAVAFTGADNDGVASTLSGTTWSVQGNTLRSDTVISAAADALQNTEGPLEMRLMAALEAGADQGGDKRCPADAPAKSAFLTVARAGDDRPSIDINADPLGAGNPIPRLREKLEADGCQHAPIPPAWLWVIGALLGLRRAHA